MDTNILDEISNFIFTSKYARYDEKLGRRETWLETVGRLEKMHLKKYGFLSKEDKEQIKWAFDLVRDKRVVPSMRSLQFGGKAIETVNERIFNCAVRHVDSLRSFSEIFFLLLCGTGVGIGLSKDFLGRLPDLVNASDKTGTVITYIVEDTIQGWADSIEALLSCYFRNTPYTGRKIVFDFSRIRPKGAPLKTGGGKAPGYKGLKNALNKIKQHLDHVIEYKNLNRLRAIDAYDILMHCADAVLSGGVRRSATSVVFDLDDLEMINAKTYIKVDKTWSFDKDGKLTLGGQTFDLYIGKVEYEGIKYEVVIKDYEYEILKKDKTLYWKHIFPQRGRSNNSVLIERDNINLEQFKDIIERTKQFGEPGFVFGVKRQLFNPCFPGYVELFTKTGKKKLADILIGEEVWSEAGWTKVISKWSTGIKRVYAYKTEIGKTLYATKDHKILQSGVKIPINDADSIDFFNREGKLKTVQISTREFIEEEEVFDLTVDNKEHTFWCNGFNVSNCYEIGFFPITEDSIAGVQMCNLTSMNGRKIKSLKEFSECVIAASIIGTLQAGYTKFPYLSNAAESLTNEEALLGVSITGILDSPEILLNPEYQKEMSNLAVKVNQDWASKININPAARVTCVKPEGTTSIFLGCGSGIHPHHAQRYFRRVQCNKLDPVYKFFKKVNPHACEESVWSENKTDDVVTFPIQVPGNQRTKRDFSALEQLQNVKLTQENWVMGGVSQYNKKPISHNVSCTITVKPDEWEEVTKYIFENREFFAAVSLVGASSDTDYPQSPNQAIRPEDEAFWNNLVENWKHVDYTKLKEEDDQTNLTSEIVCAGGACELVTV